MKGNRRARAKCRSRVLTDGAFQTNLELGFSLVELLVTVAILSILFGIAIPHYLAARGTAQSAGAMADLKTIHSAEVSYYSGVGASTYGTLAQLEAENLLADGFSTGNLSFKRFEYTGSLVLADSNSTFSITSEPPTISFSTPSYFLDESGAVRYSTSSTATAGSSPIGQ